MKIKCTNRHCIFNYLDDICHSQTVFLDNGVCKHHLLKDPEKVFKVVANYAGRNSLNGEKEDGNK